ncbi:MAG: deoxyhypusine synthase family protein [Halobacteriota archaeon]
MALNNVTVFMGLAGAMVPAGMGRLIAFLIEHNLIDCLVPTGANIFHDCHEALGNKHYVGTHEADDGRLFEHQIDRIYDVFAYEKHFQNTDRFIRDFALELPHTTYTSPDFTRLLGKKLSKLGAAPHSLLVSGYRRKVPIFVPALADSSIGLSLYLAKLQGRGILLDHIEDIKILTTLVNDARVTGVIYVGGGVPKNFIQQTEMAIRLEHGARNRSGRHDYAIQFTTDMPQWGGLSGCTFEEAVSWGKIGKQAKKVQVFADATIALPVVIHAVAENLDLEHP